MGSRKDALEFVRQMRCGGKKYDGGGKYFRTNLQQESPLMYDPILPSVPDVPVPVRYEPLPHYGLYEYPASTGMAQNYPVNVGYVVPNPGYGVVEADNAPVVSGLDPVKDAARRIMAVENSKSNPEGGWNEKEQRWYPHKSHEGGADTIAYGIKLSNGTPEAQLAIEQGYLTDEQATQFADTLAQRYYDAAKRVYDRKYGAGEWDKLSDWSQSILTDFSYNPGLGKYPKLMEGFHSGDMDTILSEYKRYSGGQELGRNKIIREELDTLGTEHPIFRAKGGRIHIKPENRGKFTALKKRTGHSASWFKAHGTPAQKKMAVFALNARKWKHGDGGFLENYYDNGGPYGVIPLGGDYLSYLQSIPEVYGGDIEPSVVTAALPAKFNGSQEAARRYAEGYLYGAKPVSEAMNRAGQKIFNTVDTVVGLTPTPAGALTWLGHMGADTMNGEYGKVGRDAAMAAAMGLGLRAAGKGVSFLKNYWDEIGNFGEDTFRAFTDRVPGKVSTNFVYDVPAARGALEEAELARQFRMDQLGVDVPIRPTQAGEWSAEELERLRAMAGDHPMDLAAYTPEQIARAQAQMQVDAPIIHDALAGNRATGTAERFVSSGPVSGAKTASGYQIERYPGYMLKSLLEGNPLEKQLSKSGEINVSNLRNYIKSKDIKAVDKAVMEKVLASDEFSGKKSVDYNKFRKAVQDELITYDRTPDTRWQEYGISRLGYNPDTGVIGFQKGFAKAFVKEHPRYKLSPIGEVYNGEQYYCIIDENGNNLSAAQINRMMPELDFESNYVPREDSYKEQTYTFSSPRIPNGSAKHYDANTIGHSRTYTTADEPDVLHVMESQSDWAQGKSKGKPGILPQEYWDDLITEREEILESMRRHPERHSEYDIKSQEDLVKEYKQRRSDATPSYQEQYSYLADNYTSRQIQENLRYAAEKGQKKMRYPTRETAAKIEGYPETTIYYNGNGVKVDDPYVYDEAVQKRIDELVSEQLKLEDKDLDTAYPWRIKDLAFKANPSEIDRARMLARLRRDILRDEDKIVQLKKYGDENSLVEERLAANRDIFERQLAKYQEEFNKTPELDKYIGESQDAKARIASIKDEQKELLKSEKHLRKDVTGKTEYSHEDILRKYTEFPKQFKKLYKNADVRIVTDPKGNTWYEVDVPKNYLQQEWAYEDGGSMILPKMIMDKHSPDKLRKAIASIKAKRMN